MPRLPGLNVAAGGSLWQDIKSHLLHDQNAPRDYPIHAIVVEKGSLLQRVLGSGEIRVNSFHHQAVKKPGPGFKVCAWAPDGIAEAVESTEHNWVLGVQWHPECMTDEFSHRLFAALVKASINESGKPSGITKCRGDAHITPICWESIRERMI